MDDEDWDFDIDDSGNIVDFPEVTIGADAPTPYEMPSWDSPVMDPVVNSLDATGSLDSSIQMPDTGIDTSTGTAAGGGGSGTGSIASILQALGGGKGLLSDASGLAGLLASHNLQNLADQAFQQSNPFGPYRQQYATQLATLMNNPTSIESDPGYQASLQAGLKATQRGMAAQGLKGSGNMATALFNQAQGTELSYLNTKEDQLANLAGAGIAPNLGPALQGAANATNTQSSALGALGAGLAYASQPGGLFGTGGALGPAAPAGVNPTTIGATAGTPSSTLASNSTGFNSAGGEAAAGGPNSLSPVGADIGLANSAMGLTNQVSKATGNGQAISTSQGTVGGTLADAGLALGIYGGIEKGGVSGYGQSAIDATKLASNAGLLPSAVGSAAGYIAAPLTLYNEIESWQSGATGKDALGGAETGAAIGSIVPGIGTALGAVIGGAAGALSSVFGGGKVDPENASFNGYTTAYNKAGANGSAVAQGVQDPYTVLAGMFDLRSNQIKGSIPFYNKYGRMGEQKFTTDMTTQINQALTSGKISASTTPQQVYNQVVQPWINSMGAWNDSNKSAMQGLLTQMTAQYMNGQYNNWKAVGGNYDFGSSIQPFGTTGSATPKAAQPVSNPATPRLAAAAQPQGAQNYNTFQIPSLAQMSQGLMKTPTVPLMQTRL